MVAPVPAAGGPVASAVGASASVSLPSLISDEQTEVSCRAWPGPGRCRGHLAAWLAHRAGDMVSGMADIWENVGIKPGRFVADIPLSAEGGSAGRSCSCPAVVAGWKPW